MTAHARGTGEDRNDTDTGIDPDRPTTRGVVDDSACDAYSHFIGDAPAATSACFTGACADAPRWEIGEWEDEGRCDRACGGGVIRRRVRCVRGAPGSPALADAAASECPSPAPTAEVPCATKACDFCDGETCSYEGTCVAGACACSPTRIGPFCETSRTCGFDRTTDASGACCAGDVDVAGVCCPTHGRRARLDGDGVCCYSGAVDACGRCDGLARAVDVTGRCCEGALDAGGFCCASGTFDACGACDGDGSSCPVWLELRLSLPASVVDDGEEAMNAHVAEWATHALNLSSVVETDAGRRRGVRSAAAARRPPSGYSRWFGVGGDGRVGVGGDGAAAAAARPPPPPVPPGANLPSTTPSPPPVTTPSPPPVERRRLPPSPPEPSRRRRRLQQTTLAPFPVAASIPARLPFVPGRDPKKTVLDLVEQLGRRGGRAFDEQGNASDAMWVTRASRVLGVARAGACGNGACEFGETCGLVAERTVVPAAMRAAEDAVAARIRGYGTWTESLDAAKAAVDACVDLPGPAVAAAATACCPEDCPFRLKPCPAPEGSVEPCGGRGRCLPAVGQCDCFPGRGWTGVACDECAEGYYANPRGECVKRLAPPTRRHRERRRRGSSRRRRRRTSTKCRGSRSRSPSSARAPSRGRSAWETSRSAPSRRAAARLVQTSMGTWAPDDQRRRVFPFQTGGFVSRPARHPDDEGVAGRGHTVGVPIDASALDARDVRVDVRPRRSKVLSPAGRGGAESDSFDDRFEELDAFGNRRNAHGVGRRGRALDRGGVAGPSGERRARDGARRLRRLRRVRIRPAAFAGRSPDGHGSSVRREDASDFAGSAEFTATGRSASGSGFGPESSPGAPPRERFRQAPEAMEAERLVMPPGSEMPEFALAARPSSV